MTSPDSGLLMMMGSFQRPARAHWLVARNVSATAKGLLYRFRAELRAVCFQRQDADRAGSEGSRRCRELSQQGRGLFVCRLEDRKPNASSPLPNRGKGFEERLRHIFLLVAHLILRDARIPAWLSVNAVKPYRGGSAAETGTHKLLSGALCHAACLGVAVLHSLLLRAELGAGWCR